MSCAAPQRAVSLNYDTDPAGLASANKRHPKLPVSVSFDRSQIADLIKKEYEAWQGTRYSLGGTSARGIDCSGFSRHIFATLFGVVLPRTTAQQSLQGKKIGRNYLQPGDLIFFKPRSYPRHVGVYVGNGEFVHASASKGVMLSQIDARYWQEYYWTSRRIILPGHKLQFDEFRPTHPCC